MSENMHDINEFVRKYCLENNITPKAAAEVARNWQALVRPIPAKHFDEVTLPMIKPLVIAYGKWLDTVEW